MPLKRLRDVPEVNSHQHSQKRFSPLFFGHSQKVTLYHRNAIFIE